MDHGSFIYMLLISVLLGTATILLLTASLHDVATRLLPDWAALGAAAIGLALRLLDGTALFGLAAGAAVFFCAFFCWRRGWIGGGDVKLITGCSLLMPPDLVPALLLLTSMIGGVLSVIYLVLGLLLRRLAAPRRAGRGQPLRRLWRVEARRIMRHSSLPYGCAISCAALILLLGPSGPLGK